jgi:hypothetical protein
MFNKYTWLQEQTESLKDHIRNDHDATIDDLQEQLHYDIDNDCIYYVNCFDIIKGLNFTDFTSTDFEVTNVSEAAFAALYEYAYENLDFVNILEETLREIEDEDNA